MYICDDNKAPAGIVLANGNDGVDGQPDGGTWRSIDRAALTLARIIGRCMAREEFAALTPVCGAMAFEFDGVAMGTTKCRD